jgi:hypothetical protein
MGHWAMGSTLAMIYLAFAGRVDAPQQANPAGWWTDYALARAAARQSGKPLFVVFRCQP